MTTTSPVQAALRIYADDPLEDGDAVVLLDESTCLEIEGLANEWDEELCEKLASVLRSNASQVVLAIARTATRLTAGDRALYGQLREAVSGSGTTLLPLRALPAV